MVKKLHNNAFSKFDEIATQFEDQSPSQAIDDEYIQELKSEIDELRQQVEGAMVKSGNAYNFRRFQLTPIGLVSPEDINDLEFTELGYALSSLSGAVNFWLGDWANLYIDQKQREKGGELSEEERSEIYKELVHDFGLSSYRSLQQYASVCRSVSPSIRIEGVSFSHHQLVAFLPKRLKGREREFLEQAAGLTVEQFRGIIQAEHANLLPQKSKPKIDTSGYVRRFREITKLIKISRVPKDKRDTYQAEIDAMRKVLDEAEQKLKG